MSERRSFLRGLGTSPLTGGSVAIPGQPTRVAFDTSAQLRERFLWWLRLENTKLCHEIIDGPAPGCGYGAKVGHVPAFARQDAPDMLAIVGAGSASSRRRDARCRRCAMALRRHADRHEHRSE